ncbi:DnaK3 [Desulforapulum autotrophicum HRM2]|uniref:DnaK3 n=1 Tax=Desulforapulum autotrophicum (strain ATCC 43914 / DSM 3382 / VKM B-1955 / HRM2) TaxID=177437 RepID=C0QK26_DESAH|nr:Hsp70 family protein [Desulforapulum autotrophicum]ACN16052.1 DnaK3 [Desulforapulum autotrophicum HRM2]
MDFQDKHFVVGIDLGTTNCAVSYVDLTALDGDGGKNPIKTFNVPQLTGSGEFSAISVLPSFLYIPGEYDVSENALKHPWKTEDDRFVGTFARDHGSMVPARLVSSAKSWLCHARADREAKILPWGAEGVDKVSPVTATALYLRHIKKAWNHGKKDEDLFLENQFVVITVPASFDEAAREFTLKAAREAGFGTSVTLLEEPLAAFYAWLVFHENDWNKHVQPGELILVCDVGGGTTDFTLITLSASEGTPRFERLAVGDHLILGGDNIDLALANLVASKFKRRDSLTQDRWKTLCHKCRQAKEKILEQGENSVRITLKGQGRSVIAGTLAADLTREDLETILCQGFFPDVDPGETAQKPPGKAIAEFGLPYEQEPAITRHIGWFLEKHRTEVKQLLGKEPMPDHILFNGGSLKPSLLQERIRTAIRHWFGSQDSALPALLENNHPDLSVAIGASYYGLVKQGTGVRVGSGSPRSYYIGVATARDQANSETPKALCVVERGLDEGSVIKLPQMAFEVLTNQPVTFDMFSSSFRSGDISGDIVDVDDTLSPMMPMQTIVKFGKKGEQRSVPVTIEPEYTEMGSLAVWCRSSISNHRWKLEFQLRDEVLPLAGSETEVLESSLIEASCAMIDTAFSSESDQREITGLVKTLEGKIETQKNAWPLSLLRTMADHLIQRSDARRLSPEHEVRWLNLTGFCIRPGFGDAFDGERMRKLWKIYLAGPIFPKVKQNVSEWWIFCRRIAGGMNAGQQRQFFQDVTPLLLGGNGLKKKVSPQELTEIWMAAANMERLLVKDKVSLGRAICALLNPGKSPAQLFWALSRIGARELLYGSVDRVVPPREAAVWIRKMIKKQKRRDLPLAKALAQIARKTGDRTRDLDSETIAPLVEWFDLTKTQKCSAIVREKVEIKAVETSAIFGESLPQGLVLK